MNSNLKLLIAVCLLVSPTAYMASAAPTEPAVAAGQTGVIEEVACAHHSPVVSDQMPSGLEAGRSINILDVIAAGVIVDEELNPHGGLTRVISLPSGYRGYRPCGAAPLFVRATFTH